MCKYIETTIIKAKQTSKSWKPLYNFLTTKCNCQECQINYDKVASIIKIRTLFRNKLSKKNIISRSFKNIS